MGDSPEYRLGRIVWTYLRTSDGRRKEQHPAVIISPNSEIIQPKHFDPRRHPGEDNEVAVVGVSTKFRRYPDLVHFVLPFRTGGHPETKLKTECAAIIGWYDLIVIEDDVLDLAGQVPVSI